MGRIAFLLGTLIEKLHIPATIAVLGFGRLWLSRFFYIAVLGIVVMLQSLRKECPLNPIVVSLKRKHQPSFPYNKQRTFIWRFFQRYGKLSGAIFMFLFWITVSWLISVIF